jgi:transcriptional regulator with PAS, ATPase and Fis domain
VHDSWRGVHDSWGGIEPPDVRYAIPILGQSPKMQRILRFISKVAPTESTVLITGESGTGKELAARAIHLQSPRASQEFVPINCGALPEALLESELFGHVKGAFTGALSDKAGLFEVADSGTLFLDEVAEMPPSSQVKLLRALEERRVRRVGGRDLIPVNVRIITATNRNLRDALASGEFRKDLYYRLNVFQIDLPPLRDRREDIPLLAMYFLQRYSIRAGKQISNFSSRAQRALVSYSYPGNVRELENAVERAVALTEGDTITEYVLPPAITESPVLMLSEGGDGYYGDSLTLREVERLHIQRVLTKHGWSLSKTARSLGISRSTLWRKISSYGIKKPKEMQ